MARFFARRRLAAPANRRCMLTALGATVWYGEKAGSQALATHFGRTPMADKSNDPVAMWQNMIGEMEKGFNSFANQAMASPEFSKVMNQVGGVARARRSSSAS
jgi:hypothetical protein